MRKSGRNYFHLSFWSVISLQCIFSLRDLDEEGELSPWPSMAWKDSLIEPPPGTLDKPKWWHYPEEWQPDGEVPMDGGSWYAICYTPERAKDLGVDMQGFALGSERDLDFQAKTALGSRFECKPKGSADEQSASDSQRDEALLTRSSSDHDVQPQQENDLLKVFGIGNQSDGDGVARTSLAQPAGRRPQNLGMQSFGKRSPRNLRAGRHGSLGAVHQIDLWHTKDAHRVFSAFDADMNNFLSFAETVLLAHQLVDKESTAFPFSFQRQVWKSFLSVDLDKDRQVNINEFTEWFNDVQTGYFKFTFSDTEAANKSTSAIVVFGQLLKPDRSATEVLRLRVQKAAEVFKKGGFKPIIVSGGDPQNRGISEALVMQNELVALGVPASIIKMESESKNTLQNALNILDNYGEAHGLPHLFLVTSNFHMPRTMYLFEAVLVYYHLHATVALEPVPVAGGCPEIWEVVDIEDPGVNQMTLLQRLEQEFCMLSNIEYYIKKDSPPGVKVKPLAESRKQKALQLVTRMITKEKERLGLMEVKAKPCTALQ